MSDSSSASELAAELDNHHVDDVSEALCENLSDGKLICLKLDLADEIERRYREEAN